MRWRTWGCALGVVAAGCASLARPSRVAVAPARDRAQREWERGNQAGAIAELLLVAGRCPASAAERHALLTAAAVALDPTSGARQVDLGASLAARYLATAPREDVDGRPLARSLYLIALELGADPVTVTGCVSPDSSAAVLPQSAAPSMPDRIKVLERELARLRDELVRIRKTLEPSE